MRTIFSIDVVLQNKFSTPDSKPAVQLSESAEVKAVKDFLSDLVTWVVSAEEVAAMPAADGYSFWLVVRYVDGTREVFGVKEKELVRDGYRSPISKRQHTKLAELCGLVTLEPFTL